MKKEARGSVWTLRRNFIIFKCKPKSVGSVPQHLNVGSTKLTILFADSVDLVPQHKISYKVVLQLKLCLATLSATLRRQMTSFFDQPYMKLKVFKPTTTFSNSLLKLHFCSNISSQLRPFCIVRAKMQF